MRVKMSIFTATLFLFRHSEIGLLDGLSRNPGTECRTVDVVFFENAGLAPLDSSEAEQGSAAQDDERGRARGRTRDDELEYVSFSVIPRLAVLTGIRGIQARSAARLTCFFENAGLTPLDPSEAEQGSAAQDDERSRARGRTRDDEVERKNVKNEGETGGKISQKINECL